MCCVGNNWVRDVMCHVTRRFPSIMYTSVGIYFCTREIPCVSFKLKCRQSRSDKALLSCDVQLCTAVPYAPQRLAVTNCSECSVRIFGSLQRINSCIIRCQAENQSSRELRLSSRCETWQLIFTAEFCNASCKFKDKQSHPTLDLPL